MGSVQQNHPVNQVPISCRILTIQLSKWLFGLHFLCFALSAPAIGLSGGKLKGKILCFTGGACSAVLRRWGRSHVKDDCMKD